MLSLGLKSSIFSSERSHFQLGRSRREARWFKLSIKAKKPNFGESAKQTNSDSIYSPFKITKSLIARAGVALFALGFIDAGYSGDWSRIGVITRENEEVLKFAAFLVIPLCIFVIVSIPKDDNETS